MAAHAVAHLDTHVLVWLHAGFLDRLPAKVLEAIEDHELRVSPMAVLELEYLFEIGRLRVPSSEIMVHLTSALDLQLAAEPFAAVANAAIAHRWTRDPFDRIIVAQAETANAPLLTKDETIRDHFGGARWA